MANVIEYERPVEHGGLQRLLSRPSSFWFRLWIGSLLATPFVMGLSSEGFAAWRGIVFLSALFNLAAIVADVRTWTRSRGRPLAISLATSMMLALFLLIHVGVLYWPFPASSSPPTAWGTMGGRRMRRVPPSLLSTSPTPQNNASAGDPETAQDEARWSFPADHSLDVDLVPVPEPVLDPSDMADPQH